MKVLTKAYGSIEVDEYQKITFPRGLLGFESLRDFVLLDAERQPFFLLQSMERMPVAFILIDPFIFRPDYEANIDNEDLESIGITDPKKAIIFTIVTMPPDGSPMTANLQGPLVINKETHTGLQAVLMDTRWKTKHDIIAELAANAALGAGGEKK
ncbi:MAG: flagellar assembly protein FliW [Treponema sp.]|nr:flagellar assembly protein FliW [Treponema sp.]